MCCVVAAVAVGRWEVRRKLARLSVSAPGLNWALLWERDGGLCRGLTPARIDLFSCETKRKSVSPWLPQLTDVPSTSEISRLLFKG